MNAVLTIALTLVAIIFVIPIVLLGIVSYIYVASGFSSTHLANKIKTKMTDNYVRIKQTRIGNDSFSIYTITKIDIMGMQPYGRIYDQLVDLQTTIDSIVNKITNFQLEKQYPNQDALQSQVNAFCNNFKELGKMLANNEIIDGDAIESIIKKIWDDNRFILSELHDYEDFLDRYIEVHHDLLFRVHSSEGELIPDTHKKSGKSEKSTAKNQNTKD